MDHLLALRAFVRIAEAGSFAKAADSLNLPRSTVSKLLQDLESHLGTKLVERTTRAVAVTDTGAAYYDRAVRILADIEDMDSNATQAHRGPKGRLRVDVGSSVANIIIIPALFDFHAKFPGIDLQLGISDRYVDLIGEGVDCVIRTGVQADTSLVARKLCEFDMLTCASRLYLERAGVPNTPDELDARHRMVGYFSAASGRATPFRFMHGTEEMDVNVQPSIAMNESTAHLRSLVSGLGIGQTYGFMARPHLKSGELVEILEQWKPRNHSLHLVYPPSKSPSPRLRAFIDWAVDLFAAYDARRDSHHP